MDGTLAVIYALASLTDLQLEEFPQTCFARTDATARLSFQVATIEYQREFIGEEIFIGYDMGRKYGPIQPTFGLSVSDQGNIWVGLGGKWTGRPEPGSPIFAESYFMPGVFTNGDGPDLGEPILFRSSLGFGYEFENGSTLTLSYDHRSNADLTRPNKGQETISIRYAIAFD